eukprot:CAMPEP_0194114060 /NCGR_PEP_ID=MMETSP0150-20130528/18783_1 /TAXON_ID=122233 /ORGANISM="Chaetoceros debilis, Strain MM31A-1" /LENGTH=360 /DNA_ID=CAMNT_0038804153 /DNA_START=86 /DNA_END=1165 /DNA_ORIENTATION=+
MSSLKEISLICLATLCVSDAFSPMHSQGKLRKSEKTQISRYLQLDSLKDDSDCIECLYEREDCDMDHNILHKTGNNDEGDSKLSLDKLQRRKFLSRVASVATLASLSPITANAYERSYPVNLDFANGDSSRNLETIREERISAQKSLAKQTKSDLVSDPFAFKDGKDVAASAVWGGALWLLSGSRSNPLVRPIANALYDPNTNKGAWLKDRNDGLFAPFPAAFSILMTVVFLILGVLTDRSLLLLSEGDSSAILQLAGVSLIGGASLELGRIASGEKMITRDDAERDMKLEQEFEEFAQKRLKVGEGGSVHRSEVISAFRRFYAKYRVENDQFPLNDLEIERLLRNWNKKSCNQESMSSA